MTDPVLPALREDLELLEGDAGSDGEKSFLIRDGLLNRYIRISADTAHLLASWRPGMTASAFVELLAAQGLQVTQPQIMLFLQFLGQNQLVQRQSGEAIASARKQGRKDLLQAGLQNYLFFKIPLLYPDAFIKRNKHRLEFLFSPWFMRITVFVLLLDIIFLVPRIDRAAALLSTQDTLSMALKFAAAYVLCKIIHEFAHGFVAARQGCMVSSMGVGFMLAFPVFYADVTDSWRISSARGRLAVASAGLIAEMTVAVYATALWILNPIPALEGFFLYLAATIWISSLLINGNPLMRFDGYHILSDYFGEKNLQAKSFAASKALIRYFLGFTRVRPKAKKLYFVYGFAAMIYRVLLITGIALVLYHLSFRLLGLVLFAVEIWVFLLLPVLREIWTMKAIRKQAGDRRRLRLTALTAFFLVLLMFIPFSTQVGAPAIATREKVAAIYTREAGLSLKDFPAVARPVGAGEALVVLSQPDQEARLEQSETAFAILQARRANTAISEIDRTRIQAIEAEIELEIEKAQAIRGVLGELSPRAPMEGVFWPRDTVHAGQWIGAKVLLGHVVSGSPRAVAYVSERDLATMRIGAAASFSDSYGTIRMSGRVTHIDFAASPNVSFPELASVNGGPIEARASGRNMVVAMGSVYRIEITLDGSPLDARLMGSVRVESAGRSVAQRVFLSVLALFRREAHFD